MEINLGTYWSGSGKHQDLCSLLDEKTPNCGYTSNPYMNLWITMSKLYYDAYNNGGCNIEDNYEDDFKNNVLPYLPDVDLDMFKLELFSSMEQYMDQALEFLQDKPMDFPVYTVWIDRHPDEGFSREEPPADIRDHWLPITFGLMDELEKWCIRRANIDRDMTDEIKMMHQTRLPDLCFSVRAATGELTCIKKGIQGCFRSEWNTNDVEKNRATAAYMNEKLGVSDAQVKAMVFGSMFGWNLPGADPKSYMKVSLDTQISGAKERQQAADKPSVPRNQEHSI